MSTSSKTGTKTKAGRWCTTVATSICLPAAAAAAWNCQYREDVPLPPPTCQIVAVRISGIVLVLDSLQSLPERCSRDSYLLQLLDITENRDSGSFSLILFDWFIELDIQ